MGSLTLIINLGSSSKKYACYEGNELKAMGKFESNGKVTITLPTKKEQYQITTKEYKRAILFFANIIGFTLNDLKTVGIRVVAPGTYFQENRLLNTDYLKKLKAAMKIAPLHISQTLEEYLYFQKNSPHIPVMAISDSAFHKTIANHHQLYSIDHKDSVKYDVKKFGYHGISIQSVIRQLKAMKIKDTAKIIVCHLGSGSSITALKKFKSIETTMGFTPLSGLTMATRPGDIDPGLLLFLLKIKKWNPDTALTYFSEQCGLKGITGTTSDMRTIITGVMEKDPKSILAFDIYINEIKKMIGAYMALLGGLDALIFTGGIGENSSAVRTAVCNKMESFGIYLNQSLNKLKTNEIRMVNNVKSKITIAIVPTAEEQEVFHQIQEFKKTTNS